jgi:hypothetical protein
MAWGRSDEEKAAAEAAKQAQRAEKQAQREAEQFAASPVGRAVAARERGDAFFQLELDIAQLGGSSGYGSSEARVRRTGGRPDLLGQIEEVGWHLDHVGYVFVETGSTSTNRVLSTGQGTVTRGVVQGIYLFRAVSS